MEMSEIARGSRVTYAIGDAEYDAVALGPVTTGYNNAIRKSGFFLSLRYLDENAEVVTISGAPLLGVDEGRLIGWHMREADSSKRPESQPVQPAPDHEIAQPPRPAPLAVLGIGPEIVKAVETFVYAEEPGSGTERVSGGDYSQTDDPYGIAAEYTSQSAAVDVRGNSPTLVRSVPTQEEADAVVAQALSERYETKTYADGTVATGIAPLPDLSPAEQDALPSVEDLDAVASEAAAAQATAAPTADEPASHPEAAE